MGYPAAKDNFKDSDKNSRLTISCIMLKNGQTYFKILGVLATFFKVCLAIFNIMKERINVKGLLSGLRQFLATERPLKIMKNAFFFKIFKLLL